MEHEVGITGLDSITSIIRGHDQRSITNDPKTIDMRTAILDMTPLWSIGRYTRVNAGYKRVNAGLESIFGVYKTWSRHLGYTILGVDGDTRLTITSLAKSVLIILGNYNNRSS